MKIKDESVSRMIRCFINKNGALATALAFLVAHPALAQTAAAPEGGTQSSNGGKSDRKSQEKSDELQEVVVTAQRRAENIQKIAVAVTSVDSETLSKLGNGNVATLAMVAPDVTMTDTGGNGLTIGMRGIITENATDVGDPAVAFEHDGLYNARSGNQGDALFDVDHVEVLRGPQGTLYGRNATTGVINVISKMPDLSNFSGEGYIEAGNYSTVNVFGVLNAPLSDDAGARVAVMTQNHDPFYNNPGLAPAQMYGDRHETAARTTFLWNPTDLLSVTFRGYYETENDNGGATVTLPLPAHPYTYSATAAGVNKAEGYMGQLTVSYKLPFATLTYDGGWQEADAFSSSQSATVFVYVDPADSRAWQHELRLSNDSDFVKWTLGLYYYHEQQSWMIYILPVANFLMPDETDTSRAAYGQATWSLTHKLRFITGLRYTSDSKYRIGQDQFFAPGTAIATVPQDTQPSSIEVDYGNIHSNRVNYKTGFEFDVTDKSMAYATVATAYKQGGFFDGDQRVTDNTYKPEDVTSFEVGYKSRFFDNHLQTNWSLFTYRYKDFQVSDTNAQDVTQTYNAQLAKNTGLELEVDWVPGSNDRVGGSFTWLHARYAEFILPEADDYGRSSYSGNTLPNAPTWGVNLNYDHIIPLAHDKEIDFSAIVHWQSGEFLDFQDLGGAYQAAYSRTNLNLSYGRSDGKWKLTAFVRNLEDHAILATVSTPSPGGAFTGTLMTPRTYGLRFDVKL